MNGSDHFLVVPIAGFRVTDQRGVPDVTLVLRRGDEEAELSFHSAHATLVRPEGVAPHGPFDWRDAVVVEAEASSRDLTVRFDNGIVLRVRPARQVESWQVVTPEGFFVASPE